MSTYWPVGSQGCTTSARAATRLSSVCSSRGGLLRDRGHGTDGRRHARSSIAAIERRPRQWSWGGSEEEEEEGNNAKGEDDEDYTPLSDVEKDETYCDTDEIKTAGNEAPIPTGRLRDLLNCLDITTLLELRIKRVPRPGWEEYKAIVEIFNGANVLSHYKGPAFRATYQDAVSDAAW
jgi:hypothetical protein